MFAKKNEDDRLENIASVKSSFFGLNNRLIIPGILISLVTTIPISRVPLMITVSLIVVELYLKLAHRTDLFSLVGSIFRKIFGSKRKTIRN